MKRLLVVLLFCSVVLAAQTHSVTLTWADSINPAGTTYNIYRAAAACSGTPTLSKINAAAITTKTYIDTTVQPGVYCYAATAVYNAVESAYSNLAPAPVPAFSPTGLTVTVQ